MPRKAYGPEFRRVYIGLGSNREDPAHQLERAAAALRASPALHQVRVSSLTWTRPSGPIADQPDFLNGAAGALSDESPERLLSILHEIEASLGLDRASKVPQGPRRVDLDLLLVGDLVRRSETLTLPHPELCRRRFVLEPLAELDPGIVEPVSGRTIAQLLEALP